MGAEGHVTKNFKRAEFLCKCGECKPGFYVSTELAKILQMIRDEVDTGIIITSGLRCKKHNKAVGGASESYHMLRTGILLASDITYADPAKRTKAGMMWLWILADKFIAAHAHGRKGGVGLYSGWLHIDVRKEDGARWIDKGWKYEP